MPNNAVIGQSGGPTSVINQSLVGVILAARRYGHIDTLYGARHGVRGVLNDDLIPLDDVPEDLLERIAQTPASALGSTRDKPDEDYCRNLFSALKKRDVRYFFYVGGNDSADTARIVREVARQDGYDLHVYHVPKTIDNDLRVHDHTPGFGSAARFVTAAMIGDDFDNRSLTGIKINVVMGRHAGFLTAASALARVAKNSGPHLIFVPEKPVSEDDFAAAVERVYSKLGRCVVAVSEGVTAPDGKTFAEHMADDARGGLERDAHGNIQLSGTGALGDYLSNLVTSKLQTPGGKKLRVRADTYGYLQRSFAGFVSEVDATEARLVGEKAVEFSADPAKIQGSVVMTRRDSAEYQIDTHLEPLENVARHTKHMDKAFLTDDFDVTDAWLDYVRPLVGSLPVVGTFDEAGL